MCSWINNCEGNSGDSSWKAPEQTTVLSLQTSYKGRRNKNLLTIDFIFYNNNFRSTMQNFTHIYFNENADKRNQNIVWIELRELRYYCRSADPYRSPQLLLHISLERVIQLFPSYSKFNYLQLERDYSQLEDIEDRCQSSEEQICRKCS